MNKTCLFLITSLTLTSCIVFNKTTELAPLTQNTDNILSEIKQHNPQPEWVYLTGKISTQSETKKIDLSITIKAKKDSIIFFSLKAPFGIELFRGQISTDSIFFIDRIKQTYSKKEFKHIRNYTQQPLTFKQLYSIITGNYSLKENSYKCVKEKTRYICSSEDMLYEIDAATLKTLKALVFIKKTKVLECVFSGHTEKEKGFFPKKNIIKTYHKDSLEIQLEYYKIILDKPQKILCQKPKKYVESK
jgi:hypothetical protein